MRVARAMADPSTNVAVAREDSRLIAFGIMQYRDETAHLALLAVRSSHRRQGVGSAMLLWLEEVARIAGISTIRVEARDDNLAGKQFYKSHGYRRIARVTGMYSGMEDGVCFQKRLRESSDQRLPDTWLTLSHRKGYP